MSTFGVSFTNFGDGHRGTKDDAITAIEGSSVKQVPGSAEYVLTIATEGDVATGNLVFLLYDPTTKAVQVGTRGRPDAVHRLHREPHGQGHVGGRPDAAQPRPGGGPDR